MNAAGPWKPIWEDDNRKTFTWEFASKPDDWHGIFWNPKWGVVAGYMDWDEGFVGSIDGSVYRFEEFTLFAEIHKPEKEKDDGI